MIDLVRAALWMVGAMVVGQEGRNGWRSGTTASAAL